MNENKKEVEKFWDEIFAQKIGMVFLNKMIEHKITKIKEKSDIVFNECSASSNDYIKQEKAEKIWDEIFSQKKGMIFLNEKFEIKNTTKKNKL